MEASDVFVAPKEGASLLIQANDSVLLFFIFYCAKHLSQLNVEYSCHGCEKRLKADSWLSTAKTLPKLSQLFFLLL